MKRFGEVMSTIFSCKAVIRAIERFWYILENTVEIFGKQAILKFRSEQYGRSIFFGSYLVNQLWHRSLPHSHESLIDL